MGRFVPRFSHLHGPTTGTHATPPDLNEWSMDVFDPPRSPENITSTPQNYTITLGGEGKPGKVKILATSAAETLLAARVHSTVATSDSQGMIHRTEMRGEEARGRREEKTVRGGKRNTAEEGEDRHGMGGLRGKHNKRRIK